MQKQSNDRNTTRQTSIGNQWCDAIWNPVRGCSPVSPGCTNCYAADQGHRWHSGPGKAYEGLTKETVSGRVIWTRVVRTVPGLLGQPLTWKKPKHIFAGSQSDFFQPAVPEDFIHQVFDMMSRAHWHQFKVLTKSAERLADLAPSLPWPENVWMGVSVENVDYLWRITCLQQVPAAIRFVSLSPLLGPIPNLPLDGIHWVFVSGEAARRPRPMEEEWVLDIKDQCDRAGVPFYFNQWGGSNKQMTGRLLQGRTWDDMPRRASVAPTSAAQTTGGTKEPSAA